MERPPDRDTDGSPSLDQPGLSLPDGGSRGTELAAEDPKRLLLGFLTEVCRREFQLGE